MNDIGHRHHRGTMTAAIRRERYRSQINNHLVKTEDAWDVAIDVFLNSVAADGTPNFDIQTHMPLRFSRYDPHPEIQFDNNGRNDGFRVTFNFFDNTNGGQGSGYRFPKDAKDALWSRVGLICPDRPIYDVFTFGSIEVQHAGLVVLAANPNGPPAQGRFRYTLNVSKDGKKPYVHLDPGGRNMNGQS